MLRSLRTGGPRARHRGQGTHLMGCERELGRVCGHYNAVVDAGEVCLRKCQCVALLPVDCFAINADAGALNVVRWA